MLSVILLNVIMLNAIMLNVIMLNVIMLNAIVLNVIALNAIMLSVWCHFSIAVMSKTSNVNNQGKKIGLLFSGNVLNAQTC
jgi:hypothetical protein